MPPVATPLPLEVLLLLRGRVARVMVCGGERGGRPAEGDRRWDGREAMSVGIGIS